MGSLVCRIELDKAKGVVVTVENEDGKITQTMVFDGTAITTTCKGEEETSTITQKADSIAIRCKTFTLDAETITCTSTGETRHSSDDKMSLISKADMSLSSDAKIAAAAGGDLSGEGANVSFKSDTGDFTAKAMNATLQASSGNVKVKGMQASVTADGTVKVSGAMAELSGSASAKVDGGTTTIKGNMVTLSAQMIKAG